MNVKKNKKKMQDPEFEQQTKVLKFTEKILPIDYICWAQKSDILDLFKSKILPHFQSDSTTTTNTNTTETNNENKDILIMKHPQKPITSWKLEMKITNNKKLNKQELKKEFGSLTPREKYTVDLKDPDFIVFIDVFKVCSLFDLCYCSCLCFVKNRMHVEWLCCVDRITFVSENSTFNNISNNQQKKKRKIKQTQQ